MMQFLNPERVEYDRRSSLFPQRFIPLVSSRTLAGTIQIQALRANISIIRNKFRRNDIIHVIVQKNSNDFSISKD